MHIGRLQRPSPRRVPERHTAIIACWSGDQQGPQKYWGLPPEALAKGDDNTNRGGMIYWLVETATNIQQTSVLFGLFGFTKSIFRKLYRWVYK